MQYLTILSALISACLFQQTAAQGNFILWPPSEHDNSINKRGIENLTIYSLLFNTPKDAPIYRFESTLIIPPASLSPPEGRVAAIWPGLQNKDLLQNVLTNQRMSGSRPTEWNFLPFFCCHPAGNFSHEVEVHPGDALSTQYIWDVAHDKYVDSWSVVTGNMGAKAGKSGFTGGKVYDQKIATSDKDSVKAEPYHMASLSVEVQGMGAWDWGSFTWRNVIVMAKTKETEWCTNMDIPKDFKHNMSTPVVTTDGEMTTCYVATVVFVEPTDSRFGKKPDNKSKAK
jgi:hypothetical protein